MAGKYQKEKKKGKLRFLLVLGLAALCLYLAEPVLAWGRLLLYKQAPTPEWVDVQLISVDGSSRSGEPLRGVQNIVIHYVGNPGTTALQNRNYYENPESSVSSHFLVGLKGEIIQCIPLEEKSAASNWRNGDTISIEVCHPDASGKFTEKTYASLVKLTAWLLETGCLDEQVLIRHYDITGKNCPKYFVENPESWNSFQKDVARELP